MTAGDEEAENLVDHLLDDVDDQFQDLEREYNQAREDIVVSEQERRGPSNPLEASNERFELLSQVADLQSEIARQGDELDERDRMLAELGEQIAGFQADIAERDKMLEELHQVKQEVLEERREQARIQSLLDARAVERQELADVAQRMQNERDNVQELLTTAMERNETVEAELLEIDDRLRHVEAARDTAAQEHDARAHELIDARAEISKLEDKLQTAIEEGKATGVKAEKADALAERRGNEAGYLNRRIEALNEKLENASGFETLVAEMRRQANIDERRISELDRNIVGLQGELEASNAAVDAIATRTRDYDELVAKVGTLEQERDAAWEAASGYGTALPVADEHSGDEEDHDAAERSENAERAADLAARARELGARRAKEAAAAAEAAEKAAAEHAKTQAQKALAAEQAAAHARAAAASVAAEAQDPQLVDLESDDLSVIDSDLASLEVPQVEPPEPMAPRVAAATKAPVENPAAAQYIAELEELAEPALEPEPAAALAVGEIPRIEYPEPAPQFVFEQSSPSPDDVASTNEVPVIQVPVVDAPAAASAEVSQIEVPQVEVPQIAVPQIEVPQIAVPDSQVQIVSAPIVAPPVVQAPAVPAPAMAPPAVQAPTIAVPTVPAPNVAPPSAPLIDLVAGRKRTILPTDLVPNTPQAVSFLLNQPGVTAIVDARSTCGRTGVRPSELFDRVAALRDQFDVPVEVVVTPVSTPVGGAPELTAVGVHHVTGADTVADRIRALCMGFPADQPLVVVAGDDHVRRAAIGEEANVVEPSAVLDFLTE